MIEENKITIIARNEIYEIEHNDFSKFALIGVLESLLFDLKHGKEIEISTTQKAAPVAETSDKTAVSAEANVEKAEAKQEKPVEMPKDVQPNAAPDLKTRIGNAVKAIRGLGGNVEETDLTSLTEEELQTELEELTAQYKRLKVSREKK